MCHHTYHHYPSCGHISNWSMTSCQEYTNKLRLAGPDRSALCEVIATSHDLLEPTQPNMCVKCEAEWAANITEPGTPETDQVMEGLNNTGNIFEVEARMVSIPDCDSDDDRETISGDDDSHQLFLNAICCEEPRTFYSDSTESTSDAKSESESVFSQNHSEKLFTFYDDSSSIDEYLGSSERTESDTEVDDHCAVIRDPETIDWDSFNVETFGLGNILAEIPIPPEPETATNDQDDEFPAILDQDDIPEINLTSIQERIEATIRKRLAEKEEPQTHATNLSHLLDVALLEKDKNDRRERDAAQGIEEDPHLWDTESLNDLFTRPAGPLKIYTDASDVSPRTQVRSPRPAGPQPRMHIYRGSMFCEREVAQSRGLRNIRGEEGDWEGEMRAFSADDAHQMGLLDPVHVRGCCDERPAEWHAYYGLMRADSEFEAERRHLENIQRVPGCDDRFYGSILADDLGHARAMGVSNAKHLWGCCVEGEVDMPRAVKHRYNGVMDAISRQEVVDKGLLGATPVPGECGDYYGGLFSGYLVVECELDAWNMGLREIDHAADCCADGCAEAEPVSSCTFFGYMFAHTEQEVLGRGLQCVLLEPGYDKKWSGNLQARSVEEAEAMGLLKASQINWGLILSQ
ncbi:unnamed protein product [Penicillium olsonii]|uniref:Uncharacterized protein n=1 Tax=Penicillium olsonii TaxID=99116 RepID=A0A9W4HTW7_PENOL|nr:unnamed protein product [Penicillium olsonii]CAG8158575.1 unnamed protein product [Penicillium olsonii]